MRWTVVPTGVTVRCGGCGVNIVSGEGLALLTTRELERCRCCAGEMGYVVDEAELDLERWRLARERGEDAPSHPTADAQLAALVRTPRRPRVPVFRSRPLKPYQPTNEFDPRAAAANERG